MGLAVGGKGVAKGGSQVRVGVARGVVRAGWGLLAISRASVRMREKRNEMR